MRKEKILTNFIWRLAERSGAQVVSLIVSIILARLLSPTDYGIVALMTVVLNILGIFVDSGFSSALIQKKNADDLDFSSVFYFNVICCFCLFGIVFLIAPFVASFYQQPEMTAMIRVSGITFIISGVKSVQTSYVSKNMMFKRFFFATLGGTIGAAIIGILMAYAGFGAWALIIQSLFNNAVDTIILWITVKWRPKRCFSFTRLKALFDFGWKMLACSLLNTIYENLRSMIIGKVYSSADLAQYNRGNSWPNMIVGNVNSSIDSILLPSMSNVQDDRNAVKAMTRRSIKIATYVMSPLLMGLCFIAEPLVCFLVTDKWLPSVVFMRIFCVTYMFWPIHTANLNAIKAMGRSDIFFRLEIIKKIVGLIALIVSVPISVVAMGYSLLFTSVASQIINSWPNRKLLNYGYLEQLKDILPGILLAVAMGFCIYPVQWLGISDILTLCIQVPLGAVIYILGSILFKLDSFEYLLGIIKPYFQNLIKRT